ncbi:MAG: heavy metal translocating P-type ATPase [Pseudomonadales bacterium]
MTEQPCYHCGLPAPDLRFCTVLLGQQRVFCCPGCLAVSETIVSGGLGDYYKFRDQPATQADADDNGYSRYDDPRFQQQWVVHSDDDNYSEAYISIGGITCAACTWLIEKHIGQLSGIESVNVNLARRRALIRWQTDQTKLGDIFQAIHSIGYRPYPWQADREEAELEQENRSALLRLGVAGIGMMQVGMYAIALHAGALQGMSEPLRDLIRYSSLIVSTLVVFYAARPFFVAATRSIMNRHLGMDVPISIAIGTAYLASLWATISGQGEVYFDSVAMFTFLLLLSRYLEMRARYSLSTEHRAASQTRPDVAWRIENSVPVPTPPAMLNIDDIVMIKPGEPIPVDGMVMRGNSDVSESVLTGEHLPVTKRTGDRLSAGSLNGDGTLTMRVAATIEHSTLSTINRLLEHAQQEKPRAAQLADQLAGVFVGTVLILAAIVFIWWFPQDPNKALLIALSVMIVSCPCALSLATPTAITAAMSSLREKGLLLRKSQIMESLAKADLVIFDKTGTLTDGQLSLNAIAHTPDRKEQELWLIACALELHSSHPIASAFKTDSPLPDTGEVTIHSGHGIEARIGEQLYRIGTQEFIGLPAAALEAAAGSGDISVWLADRTQILARFDLSDNLRESAKETLSLLNKLGLSSCMLSGDNSGAADYVASQLSLSDWQKSMSAEHKLEQLQQRQQAGSIVIAVGDGINDLPLLAASDISISVANATDLTRHNTDCIMVSNDLRGLATLVSVSRKTRRIIRQNLSWSLAYNITAIPLAAAGLVPPWLAAIGMSASSLVVVANAMRLLRT